MSYIPPDADNLVFIAGANPYSAPDGDNLVFTAGQEHVSEPTETIRCCELLSTAYIEAVLRCGLIDTQAPEIIARCALVSVPAQVIARMCWLVSGQCPESVRRCELMSGALVESARRCALTSGSIVEALRRCELMSAYVEYVQTVRRCELVSSHSTMVEAVRRCDLMSGAEYIVAGLVLSGTGTPGEHVPVIDPETGEQFALALVGPDGTWTFYADYSPEFRPPRVWIAGQAVYPSSIDIEEDITQAVDRATLTFPDADIELQAHKGSAVVIELFGDCHVLQVDEEPSGSLSHGEYRVVLSCASPATLLDADSAEPVEGDLSGMTTDIAAVLVSAAGVQLHWQTLSWPLTPGRLIAAGESPLELLQRLTGAIGSLLISRRDGSLVAEPDYPVPPEDWPQAEAVVTLGSMQDIIKLDWQPDWRPGYNRYEVSDTTPAADTLRIIEDGERRIGLTTEVLVYQTPWADNFDLSHRAAPGMIVLENLGVESRIVGPEKIIVQNGKGTSEYPIYAVHAAAWDAVNLGSPTYSEDGSITVDNNDASRLWLTYTTRVRRYRVRAMKVAGGLLVAEERQ